MTPTAALHLAEAVAADGFGPHRSALAALVAGARKLGVCETIVTVAADVDAPTVVRQRAVGRLVGEYLLASRSSVPGDRVVAAPTATAA